MTKRQIVEILMRHNLERPGDKTVFSLDQDNSGALALIDQYAGCLVSYLEASENLERNGSIVAHPRTGSPIENPYLKVRSLAMQDMRKCEPPRGIDELWKVIAEE
jgi:hypothetical protein